MSKQCIVPDGFDSNRTGCWDHLDWICCAVVTMAIVKNQKESCTTVTWYVEHIMVGARSKTGYLYDMSG